MQIEISFLTALIFLVCLWGFIRLVVCVRQGKILLRRELILLLFFLNLLVLLRFTIFPLHMDGNIPHLLIDCSRTATRRINLIPFAQMLWYGTKRRLWMNLGGNVLLFVPTGFLLPFLWPKLDYWWKTIPFGILLSVFVELLQLAIPARATDVDDVILNALGVVLGYLLFRLLSSHKGRGTL